MYLKQIGKNTVEITKQFFTIGTGAGYDLVCDSKQPNKILATIQKENHGYHLIVSEKAKVNSAAIRRSIQIFAGDRIEIGGQVLLVLDTAEVQKASSHVDPIELLSKLSLSPSDTRGQNEVTGEILTALADWTQAERITLLSEDSEGKEWKIVGQTQRLANPEIYSNILVSSSILKEAIENREPVYIESVLGHPYEKHTSILQAQLYSVACLPLMDSNRKVFGALYLTTSMPGRVIRKEKLQVTQWVASLLATLLNQKQEKKQIPSVPVNAEFEERLEKLSKSKLSILIQGETGSGKEVLAKRIHKLSPRAAKPWVALNCAAIPSTLLESTLFGYVKGAFTGAVKDQAGKFVLADGGTLFLDEIGDLSMELQAKLLRVLQENEVEPVGSLKPQSIDVRVLCATHQSLEKLVEEGRFRQDLYFRLNGATIQLDSLRKKGVEEILKLTQIFMDECEPGLTLTNAAIKKLVTYDWPGNIRELKQVIHRACALKDGKQLTDKDLEIKARNPESLDESLEAQSLEAAQEIFTRDYVQKILDKCGGSRKVASHELGISERTLYRILSLSKKSD